MALVLLVISSVAPLAGLVAKGLGAIGIVFALGALVGMVLTVMVTSKINNFRRRS